MKIQTLFVFVALGLAVACDRGPAAPSAPSAPSGLSASTAAWPAALPAVQRPAEVGVNMLDACDPETFNAAIGPGTCLRNGGMTFQRFIAQLTQLGFVGAWHFAPSNGNVRVGQTFTALNKGGEVHTFTEVADFGGGIVPFLNQLAHVPTVAPECAALEPDDFVAPGGSYKEDVDHAGTHKFQCCIHPWMRLEVQASSR